MPGSHVRGQRWLTPKQRPLYVVGLPRSGTTWAARALARATGRPYVHEPFNWKVHPRLETLAMRYVRPGAAAPEIAAVLREAVAEVPRPVWSRWRRRPPVVLKDVHVPFATEFVERELSAQVVILVRHPCGLAESHVRLGYDTRTAIARMLASRELMEDHLARFVDALTANADPYFMTGAYWGACHRVLLALADPRPAWEMVSHEWLCESPNERFRSLLDRLSLRPARRRAAALDRYLARHDRDDAEVDSTRRRTLHEPAKWRGRLSAAQADAVLAGASPFGVLETLGYDGWS